MKANGKYRILQSCYWMMICVAFGYTTFFLGKYGYSAGEAGALMAVFSGISAVCQPMFGRIADRSRRFNWKVLLILLSAASALDLLLLSFCKGKLLVGFLYGMMALLMNCMQPMINAACFYYETRGVHVDFGIARGMGSMFYAVISMVLGWLTVLIGTSAIPATGLPILIVLFLTVWFMPFGKNALRGKKESISENRQKDRAEKTDLSGKRSKNPAKKSDKSSGAFLLGKYPAFAMMVLAGTLLQAVHMYMTTYLLQILENVGGNTGHLGVALAIGAVAEVPILFLFSHIIKRIPASKLLIIAGMAYITKSVVILFAGNIGVIYAAHLLQPVSYALYISSVVYFTEECMADEDRVTGQAFMTMTSAVGSVIGNLSGGWLIDRGGVTMMMTFSVLLAVVATGGVITSAVMHGKAKASRNKSTDKISKSR